MTAAIGSAYSAVASYAMQTSASRPIVESAERTSATVRAPASRAWRSAASVSSVPPEYEATNTIESGPSRRGVRHTSS